MSKSANAALAARLLRSAPAVPAAGLAALDRGLATIERAQLARQRKVRWQRVGMAVALVAAAALGVVSVRQLASGGGVRVAEANVSVSALEGSGASVVDLAEKRAVLRAGLELAAGSRIETTSGGAALLKLSTGTLLNIDGQSRVTLEARGALQHFSLLSGGLDAKVAKLAPGARFVVQTPDAEVEVRGTQFHLSVLEQAEACAPSARTRLVVREGVVEVRSASGVALVRAGERWPATCEALLDADSASPWLPVARDTDAPRAPRPRAPVVAAPSVNSSASSRSPVPASPVAQGGAQERASSTLSEQTELFAAASQAARGGDSAKALALYGKLLAAYPASGLRENAIAERMRLLQSASPAAARREAALYLAQFPNGFGKLEAERILAAP